MTTHVILTIDTELTWRHHVPGEDWRPNFALSCEPAGVGISYQLEQLAKHRLKACFFVDPMPAMLYGLEPVRRMIEPILAAGQEVQLHLHSFWHDLSADRGEAARFELTQFDRTEQARLIALSRDLLMEAGAPRPIAFRSGSFAANADTLAALHELGFVYDSSHCGADHPWPSALPLDPSLIDPLATDGVTEVPVTQIRRRDGGLRPFQICALSRNEMEAALLHAAANDHPLVTIVGHSFELASRDGRRPNVVIRRRFDRLCAFLDRNRTRFDTARFDTLGIDCPHRPSAPLPARPLRTVARYVEQAWGHARYEKPTIAAAALLAPPPVAALSYLAYAGL
jgi:hypothetical protein